MHEAHKQNSLIVHMSSVLNETNKGKKICVYIMYIKYLFMRYIIKIRKTIQNRRITHPFLFEARTTPSV